MRLLRWILLPPLLLLLGWWLVGLLAPAERADQGGAGARPATSSADGAEAVEQSLSLQLVAPGPVGLSVPVLPEAQREQVEATKPSNLDSERRISGEVWLTDARGHRQQAGNGQLTALVWPSSKRSELRQFEVRAGRFSGPWGRGESQRPERWEYSETDQDQFFEPLLGLPLVEREQDQGRVGELKLERPEKPETLKVRLEFRVLPAATLFVTAADTGQQLPAISGVRLASGKVRGARHPVDYSEEIEALGDSPLGLLPRSDRRPGLEYFLLSAPGYAWTLVPVDFLSGGMQAVQLERAASLSVRVEGVDPQELTELRMQLTGNSGVSHDPMNSVIALPTGTQAARWDGLLPGRVRVQLCEVSGRPFEDVAPAGGMLTAGVETELILRRIPELTRPVRISGELQVPAAYGLEEPGLLLINSRDAVEDWLPDPVFHEDLVVKRISPGLYAFEGQAPRPGPYQLLVAACDYISPEVLVPVGGLNGILVRVPELAEFEVLCRLSDGSEPDREPDLLASWRIDRRATEAKRAVPLRYDPGTRSFHGRCPAGYLELQAVEGPPPASDCFVGEQMIVQLAPGDNRFEYRVCRPLEVLVEFATEAPASAALLKLSQDIGLERLDGPAQIGARRAPAQVGSRSVHELLVQVSAAGRYRLTPAPVPGYRQPLPVDIQVAHGEMTRVQVAYERLQPPR
jgi:hypothetical protein